MTVFDQDIPLESLADTCYIDASTAIVNATRTCKKWVNAVDVFETWEEGAKCVHVEKHIPKDKIIGVPLWHVRTSRRKPPDIEAKSKLGIPGQHGTQLGLFWTESPLTSPFAALACAVIMACHDWDREVF